MPCIALRENPDIQIINRVAQVNSPIITKHNRSCISPKDGLNSNVHRNLTILVAEDSPTEALLLLKALAAAHITNPVQIVQDGEEAIAYLRGSGQYANRARHPFPSVILTDLKMPRLDGFEILKWLRAHPECSVIPVIVLTNSSIPDDIRLAYQLGANSYIIKPHAFNELVQVLRTTYEYWAICAKPPVPGQS
jgi:CheY-like chemotaxis protein